MAEKVGEAEGRDVTVAALHCQFKPFSFFVLSLSFVKLISKLF